MNLLITGAWRQATEYLLDIKKLGHNVEFLQVEKEELPCAYEWVEGIICNGLFLSHPIEKFVNLKYIQLTSAGFDRVPMKYVAEHNIKIYNASGVYSIPMAEYAVAGVLQLYKNAKFFYESQNKHEWKKCRDLLEVFGKKVCIVGCGSVGTECAKRFKAFGCEIWGVNVSLRIDDHYDKMIGVKDLNSVLPHTDILVLTLPLTEETRYLINKEKLATLKKGAVLVNISRGAIVDYTALIENSEKIGGAVLDVFEEEPLCEDSPLWNMENVIISPHNSFVGDGNAKRLAEVIMKNLGNE